MKHQRALIAVLLIIAIASSVLAQSPRPASAIFTIHSPLEIIYGRINFTAHTPYELKPGGRVLPAGNYILYQIEPNDPTLFALYPDHLGNRPVAMIRTRLIDRGPIEPPQETKIFLSQAEAGSVTYPVIGGWMIRDHNSWVILSVVERKDASHRWAATRRR